MESRVEDILLHWQELRDQGRSVAPEELCRSCPELLNEVKGQIAIQESMSRHLKLRPATASGENSSDSAAKVLRPTTLQLQPGVELVRGYRLLARVGQGGFGEVWKAAGPSGFPVAIKVVPFGEHKQALLRAMRIVRDYRHPNLVGTFWRSEERRVGKECRL